MCNIEEFLKEIYKELNVFSNNVFLDYLPLKNATNATLNFNNIYITYTVKNVEDLRYKDNYILEIEFISKLENNIEVKKLCNTVDKSLNFKWLTNSKCKITRTNTHKLFFNDIEENKAYATLIYNVFKY